ncbi:MAG: ACP S-malonyltransferase [Leptospirales bacterium]|nr:ACP S-malonyltransferase [Leptospirales bacterium]
MSDTLFQQAKAGQARFFVQFGGQGAPWFKELSKYFAEPRMKRFFDVALEALDEERPRVEGTVGLPLGLDIKRWLADEASLPDDEYLGCAAVSIPMIQVTQLAHLESIVQNGFDRKSLLEYTVAASGHSQGLIPASLVALGLEGDAYYAAMAKYVKYLLYLGVSAQKAYPHFAPSEAEIAESTALGSGAPAPMVAILGETHASIEAAVKEVNAGLPADQQLHVSLYNSPQNRIVSSFRASLIALNKKLKPLIDEKKLKFVYLRTTCPFHCPLMNSVGEFFEPEIKRIGFDYSGAQLQRPVYSFYDSTDLRLQAEKLPIRMYVDMAIHPLYWEKSMKPAAENSAITHILDFGPGKTSQRLSTDTLSSLPRQLPVLAAATPKEAKEIV